PSWPEKERSRMISWIRPQADFLRRNEKLLNDAPARRDAVLFLPFRRWTETDRCAASGLAAALTRANVQYEVCCEDDLQMAAEARGRAGESRLATPRGLRGTKVLVVESLSAFDDEEKKVVEKFQRAGGRVIAADHAEWLKKVQQAIGHPAVLLHGPPTVRAIVRDQPRRTLVH